MKRWICLLLTLALCLGLAACGDSKKTQSGSKDPDKVPEAPGGATSDNTDPDKVPDAPGGATSDNTEPNQAPDDTEHNTAPANPAPAPVVDPTAIDWDALQPDQEGKIFLTREQVDARLEYVVLTPDNWKNYIEDYEEASKCGFRAKAPYEVIGSLALNMTGVDYCYDGVWYSFTLDSDDGYFTWKARDGGNDTLRSEIVNLLMAAGELPYPDSGGLMVYSSHRSVHITPYECISADGALWRLDVPERLSGCKIYVTEKVGEGGNDSLYARPLNDYIKEKYQR